MSDTEEKGTMEPDREEDRRETFEALERVHGSEIARRMMAYMPPVPWEDLATKADLAALEARMDARFGQVDTRLEHLDARLGQVDTRLEHLDARLGQVDARFDRAEARADRADERAERFPTHADLAATEQRLLAAFRGELVAAVTSQTRMLLLGLLGTALAFGTLLVAALRLT